MATKDFSGFISSLAKQLYAMEAKRGAAVSLDKLHNEKYQRTMTDEYDKLPWMKNARRVGRFKPVDEEQKAMWEKLAARK